MGNNTTETVIFTQRVDAGGVTHYLVVRNGPEAGRHIEITTEAQRIGRSDGVDIVMADGAVSKQHCEVVMFGDSLIIKDVGSTNGTFIDGVEVTSPTSLPVGTMLQVGETLLVHEMRTPEEVAQDEQLSEDVERAVEYVLSLLPARLTEGPVKTEWRYIPSAQLGGDAFGYHQLDDDHWVLYLVDVCGHGMGAALHTVSVMNTLRNGTLPNVDFTVPEQVLAGLNRAYPMEDHGGKYCTIWYGVYQLSTRRMVFGAAGHPPALLLKADSENVDELDVRGLPIGMLEDAEYTSSEVAVPEDATLYIYSDGVYEIVTKDGRNGTLKDLVEIIEGPEQPGLGEPERIEKAVRDQMATAAFDDDFSLLVVSF